MRSPNVLALILSAAASVSAVGQESELPPATEPARGAVQAEVREHPLAAEAREVRAVMETLLADKKAKLKTSESKKAEQGAQDLLDIAEQTGVSLSKAFDIQLANTIAGVDGGFGFGFGFRFGDGRRPYPRSDRVTRGGGDGPGKRLWSPGAVPGG